MYAQNVLPESDAADIGCRDCKHSIVMVVTKGGTHRLLCGKLDNIPISTARDTRRGPGDTERCGPHAKFFEAR